MQAVSWKKRLHYPHEIIKPVTTRCHYMQEEHIRLNLYRLTILYDYELANSGGSMSQRQQIFRATSWCMA